MNDLQKEIDGAFGLVAAMAVTGENQERAVLAKQRLKRAFEMAADKPVTTASADVPKMGTNEEGAT